MERKVSIILDDKEKQILHQAAEIMESTCVLAQQNCGECPFLRACNECFEPGDNIVDVAHRLLNI